MDSLYLKSDSLSVSEAECVNLYGDEKKDLRGILDKPTTRFIVMVADDELSVIG